MPKDYMTYNYEYPIKSGHIQTIRQFSLIEKRVLYCIIQSIKHKLDESPNCFKDKTGWKKISLTLGRQEISICAKRFSDVIKATENLKEHSVKTPNGKTYRIITSMSYNESNGEFAVVMNRVMTPYFIELSSSYSLDHINVALSLKSTFSQILYEMYCLDENIKSVTLSINELKKYFCVEDKYTKVFDLRSKVIDKAIDEIKELYDKKESDSYLSVEPIKESRKITAYKLKTHRRHAEKNTVKRSKNAELHYRFTCEELIRYLGHDSRYVTDILRSLRENSELTIQVARAMRKIIKYYKTKESSNETIGYAIRACLDCDFDLTFSPCNS